LDVAESKAPPLDLGLTRRPRRRKRYGARIVDGGDQDPQDRDLERQSPLHSQAQVRLQPLAHDLGCIWLF
jgi:hypothetical protein